MDAVMRQYAPKTNKIIPKVPETQLKAFADMNISPKTNRMDLSTLPIFFFISFSI